MSWARLDDAFPDNPKIAALSDAAFRAHVTAICYAARNLTDGFVPMRNAKTFAGRPRVVQELVLGLWELADGGFMVHHYLQYNPTREQVLTEREAAKARMQGVRSARVRPNNSPNIGRSSTTPVPDPTPVPKKDPSPPSSARGVDKLVALFARFGKCNEYTGDAIEDAVELYSEDWVERAIKVAGKSAEGQPNWSFVDKVLLRWQAEGKPDDDKPATFGPKARGNASGRGAGSPSAAGGVDIDDWHRYESERGAPAAVT